MPPVFSRLRSGLKLSKINESPFDSRRRQFYFWSNVLAFPATLYGLTNNVSTQKPALLLILLNTVLSLILLRRNSPIQIYERFTAFSLAAFSLLFLGGALFVSDVAVWDNILERSYWLYFLTLVVMNLLVTDRAVWRITVFYTTLFMASVLARVLPFQTGGDLEPLRSFGGFAFIAITTVVMLNVFGSYREQLMRERILSTTDALTGALNRRPMLAELERLTQQHAFFAVILLDVDHFKRFNDRFGHFAGDAALVEVARLNEWVVGSAGLVGRWGGEEFLAVLPGFSEAQGVELAETLRRQLEQKVFPAAGPITASFGVAAGGGGTPYGLILMKADEALYQAKHEGRNRVVAAASVAKKQLETTV
jgi:diguanylate cyclase (GGDEF)-like protein